ncbi:MAG: GNAT family N-acetyltransferase [Clostridiales bacterium]|nr:GNAT family N-acetyltransferase [Clostridiales bacterium]
MIRKAEQSDAKAVAMLADQLWPDHEEGELEGEFAQLLQQEDAAVFLFEQQGQEVGFAQCALRRDYVEGTESSPVGYLEGVYVQEDARHTGVARALLGACESWAREMGCTEFASDCELDNCDSLRFHLACGFQEANRIICFTKQL